MNEFGSQFKDSKRENRPRKLLTPKESGSRIPVFSTMLLPDCPPNMNSLALILLYTLAEYRIIESHVLEIK